VSARGQVGKSSPKFGQHPRKTPKNTVPSQLLKTGIFSSNYLQQSIVPGAIVTGTTGDMILARFEREFDEQLKERDQANSVFREQVKKLFDNPKAKSKNLSEAKKCNKTRNPAK